MKRWIIGGLIVAAVLAPAGVASAHHPIVTGTVGCADAQGNYSAVWTARADADRPLNWSVNGAPAQADQLPFTFTTSHNLSGAKPGFTANAVWSNGVTASASAQLERPASCPTTTPPTTTTTTTTTLPAPTTTVAAVTTTMAATTTSSSTVPVCVDCTPGTVVIDPTTTTTGAPPPPPTTTLATCTDIRTGLPTTDPNACTLPVTGAGTDTLAWIGLFLLAAGGVFLVGPWRRRPGWNE